MSEPAHVQLPILAADPSSGFVVPAIVADTHRDAGERFFVYFAATIRNPNTRAAYMNAVADFLRFEPVAELGSLAEIRSIHVSTYMIHVSRYIASVGERFAPQTVKLRLAALRGLFDWLARHRVLEINSAAPVRGPAYTIKHGKTPILTAAEAKRLIESIETDTLVGMRDWALIAVMVYSFARVSAAVGMNLEEPVQTASDSWLRLHEKGGKVHEMPVHHRLIEHLDAYITALETEDIKTPLFRVAFGRTGKLGAQRLSRHDAYATVRRRATKAYPSGVYRSHGRSGLRIGGPFVLFEKKPNFFDAIVGEGGDGVVMVEAIDEDDAVLGFETDGQLIDQMLIHAEAVGDEPRGVDAMDLVALRGHAA